MVHLFQFRTQKLRTPPYWGVLQSAGNPVSCPLTFIKAEPNGGRKAHHLKLPFVYVVGLSRASAPLEHDSHSVTCRRKPGKLSTYLFDNPMGIEQLVRQARKIHWQVTSLTTTSPDSQALPALLEQGYRLEEQIQRELFGGEHLTDQVMEYCFRRHAQAAFTFAGENQPRYTPSAFAVAEVVRKFMEHIHLLQGQKILSSYGPDIEEQGIIRGEGHIKPATDMILGVCVPVHEHQTFNGRDADGFLGVNDDFFELNAPELRHIEGLYTHEQVFPDGVVWRHVYRGIYFGKRPEGDRVMYLGNRYVEAAPAELAQVPRVVQPDYSLKYIRPLEMHCPIDGTQLHLARTSDCFVNCEKCGFGVVGFDEEDNVESLIREDLEGLATGYLKGLQGLGEFGKEIRRNKLERWIENPSSRRFNSETEYNYFVDELVALAQRRGLKVLRAV